MSRTGQVLYTTPIEPTLVIPSVATAMEHLDGVERSRSLGADEQFRPHPYGGGLVSLRATVGSTVFVGRHATVKGEAIVVGAVRLFDRAVVEGSAIVAEMVTLRDDAVIGGQAIVRGSVVLTHCARIGGNARVYSGVRLQHYAHVSRGILCGTMTVN